jgi:ribonuclease HI
MADTHKMYFDGGSNPNPGPSGAGALILSPTGATEWEGSVFVGVRATNNEAEYHGLIIGLEKASALRVQRLTVIGDSELVIRQMLGEYKVKALNLQPLHRRALAAAHALPWCRFEHTRRENNSRADALATAGIALGTRGAQPVSAAVSTRVLLPPSRKRTADGAGIAPGPAASARRCSADAQPQSSLVLAAAKASAAPNAASASRPTSSTRGRESAPSAIGVTGALLPCAVIGAVIDLISSDSSGDLKLV